MNLNFSDLNLRMMGPDPDPSQNVWSILNWKVWIGFDQNVQNDQI